METKERSGATGVRAASVVLLGAVLAGLLVSVPAGAAARRGGLEIVGTLPAPPPEAGLHGKVVAVDPVNRRMYYLYGSRADGMASYLIEYDIRPAMPRPLRDVRVAAPNELPGSTSPYTVIADSKRHRLLMISETPEGNKILVIDLKSFQVAEPWNLTATLPGFYPMGMTYSARDDRVYLVGDMSQSSVVGALGKRPIGPGVSVVALEAGTGELAWVRPLQGCQQMLQSFGAGSLVARSRTRPHIYVACVTGGTGGGDAYPVQAGLLRLTIDPKADQAAAFGSQVEFFPISGSYLTGGSKNGIAAFDPATDRFFLQSLARTTPGTWVFDGRISAWVGFISAPDATANWLGLNEGSGHYYIGSGDGYLLVSDGRATPVPQGSLAHVTVDGFIATDPDTNRLFIPAQSNSGYVRYVVATDSTPEAQPLRPPDYDALTADIPEGPQTTTSFSGGVNGFGVRTVLVGGYGGIVNLLGGPVPIAGLRQGDRGISAARVPGIDLREVGATATAQAVVTDTNTEAELSDRDLEPEWLPASCLDGSGDRVENHSEATGGSATVACDLAKQEVTASASAGVVVAEGVKVGSSSFAARSWRDDDQGVMTEVVAEAAGIELGAGGNTVSIAQVLTTARTSAHGRPKTASADWERVISGVAIRDAEGEVTRLGGCRSTPKTDDCGPLVKAINDALQLKMRIDTFTPDVISTPKGAFAGVQQTDADYYNGRTVYNQGSTFSAEAATRAVPALQVTVFNDSIERSRLIVQMAAVQANSIYTVSKAPDLPPPPPVVPTSGSEPAPVGSAAVDLAAPLGGDLSAPLDPEPVGEDAALPVAAGPVEGVLAVIRRSPGEAALMAAVWLLFSGAGVVMYRRNGLLALLSRGGTQ